MNRICAFALICIAILGPLAPAQSASPQNLAPLFNSDTKLEPVTVEDTPAALITRVGDRVRDRHAREGMFHVYDHFLPLYWENRTVSIEIVDRVAKGGDSVTYNMTSLFPLNKPNLRIFFEGKGTVAQYSSNLISKQVDPLHYTVTVKINTNERRPIKVGDRIEMEFSPFLQPPVKGRTNYYGTALLYVVGKGGMAPWEGRGPRLDSFPLPEEALLGGTMTLHRQYSKEPKELFKQMGTNISPASTQPFVLGRRLHHSDFGTGTHSEPGNPVYTEIVGKLGQHYTNRSCIACHTNNGRAMPAAVGAPLTKYLVRVGADASAGCTKCHTPAMKTGAYHPFAELRNQTIHPYTDLLLHDMGPGLADNMADGNAAPGEWRTTPLWGIGSTAGVSGGESYLHDGRARNLSEAILWHGGEAQASREAFRTMPADDRTALIKFLQSL